jgi:benzoyl-CoA reductase/2-hydroxyglutaryl-CoA dehydratase subunit BcrC/BadD/HgdB
VPNVELPKFKTWDLLKQITRDYHEEGIRAHDNGRKVAWCTALSPHEFLSAMDFHLVFPEHESAVMGAMNASVQLCQIAEDAGYPADLCSYARTNLGCALGEMPMEGVPNLPRPDILMACNNGCVTFNKWFQSLSRTLRVPLVFVDAPFLHDGANADTTERAQEYVIQQLHALPALLEQLTHVRFDYDRLSECVANSGDSMRSWLAGQRLGQNRPSPISSFDTRIEGFRFAETLKTEIAERLANGIAAIPGEKYRLYLDGPPPWFSTRQLAGQFAGLRACVVTGIYTVVFECFQGLDSSRPIETLAEALTTQYSNRGVEYRTKTLLRYAEEYHLDGMIMQWPQTCKPVFIGQYDQIEAIRQNGVPCLIIEGDMCDSRLYNEAETAARIESFVEALESGAV